MSNPNELVKRLNESDAWENVKARCMAVMPRQMQAEGDRLWHVFMGLLRMPGTDLYRCTETSLMLGVYAFAKLGLIPDNITGHGYLIPFRDNRRGVTEATVVIGYKGYLALAYRHPKFRGLSSPPTMVFQNDDFDFNMGTSRIAHRSWRQVRGKESGPPIACYLRANISGSHVPTLMWADEIMSVKARVRSKMSPWNDRDENVQYEMWKKTVIRRAAKTLPIEPGINPELATASMIDEASESESPSVEQQRLLREDMSPGLAEGEHVIGEEPPSDWQPPEKGPLDEDGEAPEDLLG